MPARALRACSVSGCPGTSRVSGRCGSRDCCGGRCVPKKPWSHTVASRQARGYDAEYVRNRAIVLAEESDCGICFKPGRPDDQVDHIVPVVKGGTSTRANLRRAHRTCNERRGSQLGRSVQRG